MRCPSCAVDINDDHPECPRCGFHIRDLDAAFGEPPPRAGPVLDLAGLLSPEDAGRLRERLESFQAATGCEMLVVTVPDTAPRLPTEYAFWLHNRWEVGGAKHLGLLVLLARAERRIETEVSHPLERVLSDEASTSVLEEHAVPFFRAERFGEGLYHACDVLGRIFENALPSPEEVAR